MWYDRDRVLACMCARVTLECMRLRALPSDYRRTCMRVREGSGMDIGLGVYSYLPVNFMIIYKKKGVVK